MIQLGVNIDHVASVRNARYRGPNVADGEPDPVRAAYEAEIGGADGITLHLREDRRHITDRDLDLISRLARIKLNLEMAATDEMIAVALRCRPHTAMLVPEGRNEVTTEGGLDVLGNFPRLKDAVSRLRDGGLIVSAFIDADRRQVDACKEAGFDVCEVHTGPYAEAFALCGGDFRRKTLSAELDKVRLAGEHIRASGLRFNAGHALNYHNVTPVAALMGVSELHIGHAIVSRAVFTGLRQAVADMKRLMTDACRR
jgi:pyridoxine 5-phosphate synthase